MPEANISGSIYLLTRPKLGVTIVDVLVQDRIAPHVVTENTAEVAFRNKNKRNCIRN